LRLARLREVRELRGWSQSKLAEESDVSRDGISNYETGHREAWPSTARKLADALGVEISDLVARAEELVPLDEAPQETGQPDEKRSVRDIAHAEARRQDAQDRKAARRTLASEGIDRADRISDVYDPAVYDVLRRQPSDELAGALLDAERDYVHTVGECALLEEKVARLGHVEEGNVRLREENARLRQDITELRSEAERETTR
jgi:transcriptional regulator with XRE-family HTH domain